MPPSPTYSAHRGAARQMFGSGSLRPPGAKPIFATGQRQHGIRSTVSPHNSRRQFIPLIKYPAFPLPIPADDFHRIPGGGKFLSAFARLLVLQEHAKTLLKSTTSEGIIDDNLIVLKWHRC